MDPESLNSKTQ